MKIFIAALFSAVLIAPIAVWADTGKPTPPSANVVNNAAAANQPVDACALASTSAADVANPKTSPGDIYVDGMYAESCALDFRIPADGCDAFILAGNDFVESALRYSQESNISRARTAIGIADLEFDFAASVCEVDSKKEYAIRHAAITESFLGRYDSTPVKR